MTNRSNRSLAAKYSVGVPVYKIKPLKVACAAGDLGCCGKIVLTTPPKRRDVARSRNSTDAVVRRIHGTEIGNFDLLKLVTTHQKLKAFQVLSPVEVGINQDPAAIFWAPRQFVKE